MKIRLLPIVPGTVMMSPAALPKATVPSKVVAPDALSVVTRAEEAVVAPRVVLSIVPPKMLTKSNIWMTSVPFTYK